jgi:hypothetical protein
VSPHSLITVEGTRLLDPMAGKKAKSKTILTMIWFHTCLSVSRSKAGAAAGRVELQEGAQCSLRQDKSDFAVIWSNGFEDHLRRTECTNRPKKKIFTVNCSCRPSEPLRQKKV